MKPSAPRSPVPNLLPLLLVSTALAALVACGGSVSGDATSSTPVTSVPVGEVTGDTNQATAANQTVPTDANQTQPSGALTLANAASYNLCLTASDSPALPGSTVLLQNCTFADNQRWYLANGRLRTDPNLCVSNPASAQNALLAGSNGNTVVATLEACDGNALNANQHVEYVYGVLLLQTMGAQNKWALAPAGAPAANKALVWLARQPNDTPQLWIAGSEAFAGGNVPVVVASNTNALLALDSNATGGFHIASVDSPAICLDSNYVDAAGNFILGATPCASGLASQQWRINALGGFVNQGRCLSENNGNLQFGSCTLASSEAFQINYGVIQSPGYGCVVGNNGVVPGSVVLGSCSQTGATAWTFGLTVQ